MIAANTHVRYRHNTPTLATAAQPQHTLYGVTVPPTHVHESDDVLGTQSYKQLGDRVRRIEILAMELSNHVDNAHLDEAGDRLRSLCESAAVASTLLEISRATIRRQDSAGADASIARKQSLPHTDETTRAREKGVADVTCAVLVIVAQIRAALSADDASTARLLEAIEIQEQLTASVTELVSTWLEARASGRPEAVSMAEKAFRALGRNEAIRTFVARGLNQDSDRVRGLAAALGLQLGIVIHTF